MPLQLRKVCGRSARRTEPPSVAFDMRPDLPVLALLQQLAERLRSRPFQKRVELHVAAHARSKVVAVSLAQRVDASCTVLVANFAIGVPATIIEARVTILRHSCSPINWGRAYARPGFTRGTG